MKIWATQFKAIEYKTGDLKLYAGDKIEAPTLTLAQEWCNMYKPYLEVVGELIMTIDAKTGEEVDYTLPQLN